MTVFDIKKEYFELYELMSKDEYEVNEDTGEVTDNTELIKNLMDGLDAERDEKLENIEYIKRELKIRQQALKDEAKRLSERAKSLENNQKQLLELQDFLLGGEKLKTDKFTFFYGSSEKLEIEDESKVPSDYIAYTPKIDNTNLKKAVKDGLEVEGITLKTTISLRVR